MTTGTGESLGKRASGDFDLNLAPIIDCFTVLITYLLVSASFITLAVLDAGIASSEKAAAPPAPATPSLNVEVTLAAQGEIAFRISGATMPDPPLPVPPRNGGWDMVGMARQMERVHRAFPALNEVTVSAGEKVPYKDVVRAVEVLRKFVPRVYLAG